jgi:hypothetical protein
LTKNSVKAGKVENESNSISQRSSRIPRPSETLDRGRRIKEAEAQIDSRVLTVLNEEEEDTDSQTLRKLTTMGEKKSMVLPGTRDAPRFSSSKPKELRRFIRQMEDAWRDAGVEDEVEKKENLGKYADQESEEEWGALETFGKGYSWADFKKEILENYPEASAAERGTPARIRQIVREADSIDLGDTTRLYAYRRAFLAEANKLRKAPQVMSNRELVELFMSGFSTPMGQAILQYLGSNGKALNKSKNAKEKEAEAKGVRRPEDKYDLEEVCSAATEVSENAQGMMSYKWGTAPQGSKRGPSTLVQTTLSESTAVTDKLESIEAAQASEKDRLDVVSKQMGVRFDSIENMMTTLLSQNVQDKPVNSFIQNVGRSNAGSFNIESVTKNARGMASGTEIICFGCGEPGHFQNNCERVKALVKNGAIVHNREGRVCLPDGSRVPNVPTGASLVERVDRYYANMRPTQAFYGAFEEMEEKLGGLLSREHSYVNREVEDREQRLTKLEKEVDLKERENALRAKQLKLEAKGVDKTDVRAVLLEAFDEELAALQGSKTGFL